MVCLINQPFRVLIGSKSALVYLSISILLLVYNFKPIVTAQLKVKWDMIVCIELISLGFF